MAKNFFYLLINYICVLSVVLLLTSCSTITKQTSSKENLKTIRVVDDARQYRLFVPASYTGKEAYPLVLNFHGTDANPAIQESISTFEVLGKTERFIVVSPLALFKRKIDGPITWNVNFKEGPDDIVFIRKLLNHLKTQLNIDSQRIFATGFSGGARMSSQLACDLSSQIAAIAPVAGIRFPVSCKPKRPMPVITFHGKKDNINHYNLRIDSPVYWSMGVDDAIKGWVKNNDCTLPEIIQNSTTVELIKYPKCEKDADIVFYRSSDAGHTWPGSPAAETLASYGLGKTELTLPATQLIWDFFKDHPLSQ